MKPLLFIWLALLTACTGFSSSSPIEAERSEDMSSVLLDMTSPGDLSDDARRDEVDATDTKVDMHADMHTVDMPRQQMDMELDMGGVEPDLLDCEALGAGTPHDLCEPTRAERCGLVFSDGEGCAAACASLGLTCVEGYDNLEGVCEPNTALPTLGCGDTGHITDYCECGPRVEQPGCETPSVDIFLVGDSTVATGLGWGDSLEALLVPSATVKNHGASGRSSKSFWDEGRFESVADELDSGDYLLIQFGHNDAKPEPERRTDPGSAPTYEGTYRTYLLRYVDAARDVGATPILVTSVSRMVFSNDEPRRTHGDYPDAMRRLAADESIALLDLEERSFVEYGALGEAETLRLYADPNGEDRTHFPPDKAHRVAQLLVELLADSPSPLSCYVDDANP